MDDRSNLAKAALELLPEVFQIVMTKSGNAYQHLNDLITSLFCVVRNKRSEQLSQVADECIVQLLDMICVWHQNKDIEDGIFF